MVSNGCEHMYEAKPENQILRLLALFDVFVPELKAGWPYVVLIELSLKTNGYLPPLCALIS